MSNIAGEHSSGAGQTEAEQQISRHVAGVGEKDDFWTRLHCGKVTNVNARCCYITVDFATAASQNGVRITRQICHTMIFFPDCSLIKDESSKKSSVFIFSE